MTDPTHGPSHAQLRQAHEHLTTVAEAIHELLAGPEPADPVRLEAAEGLLRQALHHLESAKPRKPL